MTAVSIVRSIIEQQGPISGADIGIQTPYALRTIREAIKKLKDKDVIDYHFSFEDGRRRIYYAKSGV